LLQRDMKRLTAALGRDNYVVMAVSAETILLWRKRRRGGGLFDFVVRGKAIRRIATVSRRRRSESPPPRRLMLRCIIDWC